MIDVKEAAVQARNYFQQLNDEVGVYDIRLEEVELTEDESFWLITLSYSENSMLAGTKYKIFKIGTDQGNVVSMKIRKI